VASEEIIRFFIEEGKEHLDTLEKGLLNLQATMQDNEQINEMFRAAHSVKGGAAMLGFSSIQKVSHRLEDYFKILKDNTELPIDQKLESLFLKGLDALRDLLELLQGPFGLRDEDASKIIEGVEPLFGDLKSHLEYLLAGGAPINAPTTAIATPAKLSKTSDLPADFVAQVTDALKQMLTVFRKPDSSETRQRLATFCNHLDEIGAANESWQGLVAAVDRAIANTNNPYTILAPFAIRELREASHTLASNASATVSPSPSLVNLADIETDEWDTIAIVKQDLRSAAEILTQTFEKAKLLKLAKLLYKAAQ
jgi:chemotaxis protein histidine kinase CheA